MFFSIRRNRKNLGRMVLWRGVRGYLREFTREARRDDYLGHDAEHGHTRMNRREFDRRRADQLERNNPVTGRR